MGLVDGIDQVITTPLLEKGMNLLFYLGQWDIRIFEWAHLYVWQALIMLDVLIVWLIWVRRAPMMGADRLRPPPPPALAAG